MWNWISKLEELRSTGQGVVSVTVTQCTGSTPREPGAKMLVLPDGRFFGTIGGGHFEELALLDALKCFAEGVSKTIRYPLGAKTGQCCGGIADLFFEVLNAGPVLYLFGAGHVGQAVCRVLEGTPFNVHVIDSRLEWVNAPEIPTGVLRHHGEWDEFVREIRWSSENTYVLIMTHRHDVDQDIIEFLRDRPLRFIGLIGSESKWARFKQRLKLKGVELSQLARVRCPVGLKLGGKAPQEIAISIAGELLEDHYGQQNSKISSRHSRSGPGLPNENTQGSPEL